LLDHGAHIRHEAVVALDDGWLFFAHGVVVCWVSLPSSNGLKVGTPVSTKSFTLRVAMMSP
jgi:hypothetical protein